jgi:hypothetical protein
MRRFQSGKPSESLERSRYENLLPDWMGNMLTSFQFSRLIQSRPTKIKNLCTIQAKILRTRRVLRKKAQDDKLKTKTVKFTSPLKQENKNPSPCRVLVILLSCKDSSTLVSQQSRATCGNQTLNLDLDINTSGQAQAHEHVNGL